MFLRHRKVGYALRRHERCRRRQRCSLHRFKVVIFPGIWPVKELPAWVVTRTRFVGIYSDTIGVLQQLPREKCVGAARSPQPNLWTFSHCESAVESRGTTGATYS